MVSPAVYLGVALAVALGLVGAYLVRLDQRTRELEEQAARAREHERSDREPPDDEPDA